MTQDEWGPIIDHDGKGCPCKGMYARVWGDLPGLTRDGRYTDYIEGVVRGGPSWDWAAKGNWTRVVRYQVRTPRALTELRALIADLPQEVDA